MAEEKKLSSVEIIKEKSRFLRGSIQETLLNPEATHFSKDDIQLTKFHGFYQQDDRDIRKERTQKGLEPDYSMMIRVKMPGGVCSAEQYIALDALCDTAGKGDMRITTRQGIQYHGVVKGKIKPLIQKINEILLTTIGACGDVVRNVMACPAPTTSRSKAQVIDCAKLVSDHFLPKTTAYHEIWLNGEKVADSKKEFEPIYGECYLPRKFKIGVAYPEDNSIDIYTNDIGIVADIQNDTLKGFTVLVGGGMGFTHGQTVTEPILSKPLCYTSPDALIPVCEAVVKVQRDFGNRANRKQARLKYLIREWGIDKFKKEVEKVYGKSLIKPLELKWVKTDFQHGWHEQGNGLWFYGLPIENGRVKDEGSKKLRTALRTIAQQLKPEFRFTAWQDVLICNINQGDKKALEETLRQFQVPLVEEVSNMRKESMACVSLPTCGLALTEAERYLPTLLTALERCLDEIGLGNEHVIVRMTGCPNSCARPGTAELAFVGRMPGAYNVYLGGSHLGTRLNELAWERVPEKELVSKLKPIFESFKNNRQTNERFGDYCHRVGVKQLAG